MKTERIDGSGIRISLSGDEVELLRLTLERASFIDTPPGRQDEILRFADDVLKAIGPRKP